MTRDFISRIYFVRFLLLLLPITILLTGCPYISEIPLEENPKNKIDSTILGVWLMELDKTAISPDTAELHICAFSAYQYFVEVIEVKNDSLNIDRYHAFVNTVKGKPIVTLRNIEYREYFRFFDYQIKKDTLVLGIVSDELLKEKYKSSKELERDMAKYIDNPKFFESSLKLIRKK